MANFELIRDFETPLTTFHSGHQYDAKGWSKIFGISETVFYEYLMSGAFQHWLKVVASSPSED